VLNEICPNDDGFLIDELGQADDWIELYNGAGRPIDLRGWKVAQGSRTHALPALTVKPGETLVLWADGEPEQGPRHLTLTLPASGARLLLLSPEGAPADELRYPALGTNIAYARFPDGTGAFQSCRYASPGRGNGDRCGPPPPVGLPEEVKFAPYTWPAGWGAPRGPLVLSEAALRPAQFVEVVNAGSTPVALDDFELRLAPQGPGARWPGPTDGVALRWPRSGQVMPGERVVATVTAADVAAVAARPEFEGALTIFTRPAGEVAHRLDFMRVPEGSALSLARGQGDAPWGTFRYCRTLTPGAANEACDPVESRDIGDRLRDLGTAGDFAALAEGGTELDSGAAKFVVDMDAGDVVNFLSSRTWDLHYTWIRERIQLLPHLSRCDANEAAVFLSGWREFSDKEYLTTDRRRYLLGTLVRYGGSGMQTVEFDRADAITGEQMRRAFFAVAAHVRDPRSWFVRAQGGRQVQALKALEGTLPVVEPNAPFRDLVFQPVTTGVSYGLVRYVRATEVESANLGPDVIVVTDDVPNDIPLIGGLITEAFQTPLSHIGVLTRNRGTPDMALLRARQDPRVAPFIDKLARLEVSGGGFTLREATAAEAQAFWDKRRPKGDRLVPRLDKSVRGPQDLKLRSLDDLPSLGAKASQLAELMKVVAGEEECAGPVPVPPEAFGIPVVHSLEHFESSGARALYDRWRAMPEFNADPRVRAQGLAEVRAAILAHPVDPQLLAAVEARARMLFGTARFRMRSSSNTEDLSAFSGAGLYTSVSAAIGDPERTIEGGLRTVWASLWADRAYDEREFGLIDESKVAMGVLVHEAYNGVERANGVAASRNVKNPIRSDSQYINAQAGEASVTNPAPGVTSDELTFTWWVPSPVEYLSRSSLVSAPVLRDQEISKLACLMRAVHAHFQMRIDPEHKNRWFTMESEFKFVGPDRKLVLKQARPYSFGAVDIPIDCREI
jgi:hypothetical protein